MAGDVFRHDLRDALRGLRRDKAFAAVAVLILALGIGANTAVFSVVNSTLLRPLPFRDADRMVWVSGVSESGGLSGLTYPVDLYEELKRRNATLEDLTSYFAFFDYVDVKLTGRGAPERLHSLPVAPGFFPMLGVQPRLGRGFTAEELKPNGPRAVLLGNGLWRRSFGADPGIVGQRILLNEEPVTVVGVMGPDFDFSSIFSPGSRVDLYEPANLEVIRRQGNTMSLIGRVKPGVPLSAVQADLKRVVEEVNAERGWNFDVGTTPLRDYVSGRIERAMVVLWCAAGLVLLIVCANLANLMIVRTTGRAKELAVRMAMGASRGRLMGRLLTEAVVLSLGGAALGVPLAYGLIHYLKTSGALEVPLLWRVEIDPAALLFTVAAAVAVGLLFGAAPGARIAGSRLQDALKETGRSATSGRHSVWVRSALVVAEVALASVLLVGTGLLLRSFVHLLDVDLGFRPSEAVAVRLETPDGVRGQRRTEYLREVTRKVEAIPGAEMAAITDALPLGRNRSWGVAAVGEDRRPSNSGDAFVYLVGPGYFRTMGIPLRGREFTDAELDREAPVIIVNETLARRLWPGQDAVGKLAYANARTPKEVIGVAADVRQTSLEGSAVAQMYLLYTVPGRTGMQDLVVRGKLDRAALAAEVRSALGSFDADLARSDIQPLQLLVDQSVAPRRFLVTLIGGFALLAVVLAALGVYGVVSYSTSQRVAEFGVRMALGAAPGNVRNQVIRSTLRVALVGVAIGAVAALGLSRVIATLLYDTSPADPVSFAAMVAVLVGVALLAGYGPALRASRVSPSEALRAE
jgi:predicted permease